MDKHSDGNVEGHSHPFVLAALREVEHAMWHTCTWYWCITSMATSITNPFFSTSTQLQVMLPKQLAISRPHPFLTPRCSCGTNIMGEMPWFGVAIDGLDDANSTRKYFPIHFCTDIKLVFLPYIFVLRIKLQWERSYNSPIINDFVLANEMKLSNQLSQVIKLLSWN